MSLEAVSSSLSAWNARAAVVRCSGAKVFLTPSHVKASLTAAMVVRSLWAELGEVWLTGVLVGWVVDRGGWFWLVVGSVVVAVDIGTWNLLGECVEGRPPRLLTDRWRHGLEKSMAGDAFGGLRRAIGHRGDHGAACHRRRLIGGKNAG